jgi:hypothetical protein
MNDGSRTFDIRFGNSFNGHTNNDGVAYFEINGAETFMFGGSVFPDQNGGRDLGSSSYRWGALYATNGTIQTSDLRLKKDIEESHYGLKEILKLRPVSFYWKDTESEKKNRIYCSRVERGYSRGGNRRKR